MYDALAEAEAQAIILPRRNAKIMQHGNSSSPPLERDEAIRKIRCVGYIAAANHTIAIYHLKCCFGEI
ncbi:MAG: hypothetical protein MK171_02270 [Pirellulales bacterium]|nr:hypothetical protein [Pirellulales bacterium]